MVPRRPSRRDVLRWSAVGGASLWLAPLLAACSDPSADKLVFLNWQDYIDPALLDDFADESGLAVTYETYSSNDELSDRLVLAEASRRRGRESETFDLIVPSDNLLTALRARDALLELDTGIVTSLGNLAREFRQEPFDPGNRVSVPWASGTTGIGYDTTVFDEPPGWEVFQDTSVSGAMTMLAESRDAYAAALFALGEDPNTTDPAVVDAATAWLVDASSVIAGFDSATYLDRLADGEVVCAHAYSSDVLLARERNADLAYTVPEEGGLRWIDSLCIPVDAANPDGANRFIEFYLGPQVSAANAVAAQVDTGNEAAREFIPQDVLDDPVIFPPAAEAERLVFVEDLGEANELYAAGWDTVPGH